MGSSHSSHNFDENIPFHLITLSNLRNLYTNHLKSKLYTEIHELMSSHPLAVNFTLTPQYIDNEITDDSTDTKMTADLNLPFKNVRDMLSDASMWSSWNRNRTHTLKDYCVYPMTYNQEDIGEYVILLSKKQCTVLGKEVNADYRITENWRD